MASASSESWLSEFGIESRTPPSLFTDKEQVTAETSQAHLLRRAFDTLDVNGVLCVDDIPLVYFKLMKQMTPNRVRDLHKQFWNHGGAAVLVVVGEDRVEIYSGMLRPSPDDTGSVTALVTTLERTASGLTEFLASVETGEFFRRNQKSFDPSQRVDRDLLDNLKRTREKLDEESTTAISAEVLDALLCRLVFTCYLFDRSVIGQNYLAEVSIQSASSLQDVLNIQPQDVAVDALYRLFGKLGEDFNGDLFSDDLGSEEALINSDHVRVLRDFFNGTNVQTGQQVFWPYDFGVIPIETISAIYERFLTPEDKAKGAFYTPRFLAEIVIDTALTNIETIAGKRFLDPACGSGIFLVGLFNRLAEEWKQENPRARNDRKSRELMRLLQESLFGVDVSLTACRITAFSLYLAYLDQLTPPDIQALQAKGRALPRLVRHPESSEEGNIWNYDFFREDIAFPNDVDVVIGNPPWGSFATASTPAGKWCAARERIVPDKQIATCFVWKATEHVSDDGEICFVLPHGVLFNHGTQAIRFQRSWFESHSIDRVLNLADLRFLLFEKAIHPALVISYRPMSGQKASPIEYSAPKADWTFTQTEVLAISSIDKTTLATEEVIQNLESPDAPQIWKGYFWATGRDRRLLDRLKSLPRLREIVRQTKESKSNKPWLIAEGFQPLGENDDPERGRTLELNSTDFIPASSKAIELFLLPDDCDQLDSGRFDVRRGSEETAEVFRAPHVLVTKGFRRIAFADFDVSFRHALRGITGPVGDREQLMFLAAYLRSPVARYYLFHTSSNWAIYRPEVHVKELLAVPFFLPEKHPDPDRARAIISEVASIVEEAKVASKNNMLSRATEINKATRRAECLIYEYFDILPMESVLLDDTMSVSAKSTQPTLSKMPVPTVRHATDNDFKAYNATLCDLLNRWGAGSGEVVSSEILRSGDIGIAIAVLTKSTEDKISPTADGTALTRVLADIRGVVAKQQASIHFYRGLMVFDQDRLFVVKPIGKRYWTRTAALNDADEIASSILMSSEACSS
ncbi:MAG: N-6 DNA methylase [Planctomycetaceae bacterium]|nr:N-6 DNA methylase [Planctomycetaceae bacterium]